MAFTVLRPVVVAVATILLALGAGGVVDVDTSSSEAEAAPAPVATLSTPIPAPAPASASPTTVAAAMPHASSSGASAAVGALFAGGSHFCSASVVHSTGGDLVLTAAHCVNGGSGAGYRAGLSFAPGYHDGVAPYGMWTVTSAVVAQGWTDSSDPDLDFAFLTVAQPGASAALESLVGANTLGPNRGFVNDITLSGYPDPANSPVVCRGTTSRSDTYQQRVACPGFPDGTSGGPWVINPDPATGDGTVTGVIGGYELGGDSPDVSYSAYFDDDTVRLYQSATG